MTRKTIAPRKAALAVCLPLGILLAGCTPATPVPAPTVEWSPSAPTGPYEDTDWVQAIRSYNLEWALASNSHDLTSPALAEVASSLDISLMADRLRQSAEDGEFRFYPGPVPLEVVDLTEDGDSARVTGCRASPAWLISKDHPEPSTDDPTEAVYNLVRAESGEVRIESIGGSDIPCDLSDAAVGLFDPQPDLTATYSPDDVKEP